MSQPPAHRPAPSTLDAAPAPVSGEHLARRAVTPWRLPVSRPIVDALAIAAAMLISGLAAGTGPSVWHAVFAVSAVGVMAARGAYDRRLEDSVTVLVARHVLASAVIATMITVTGRAVIEGRATSADDFVVLCFVSTVLLAAVRVIGNAHDKRRYARDAASSRALLVGPRDLTARLALRLRQRSQVGLTAVGYLDDVHPEEIAVASDGRMGLPVLGRTSDLRRIAQQHRVDALVVAGDEAPHNEERLGRLIATAHEMHLTVFVVPRVHASVNSRTRRHRLGTLTIDELRPVDPRSRAFRAKYALDRVIGTVSLVVLSPLLLTLALLVGLSSRGPILYRQRRVGLDGQEFDILKFRSMRVAPEQAAAWSPADGLAPGGVEGEDRRTALGRFLRRSNLDELPQLINIARGEMCLVGPRPERPEFVQRFRRELAHYDARHRVKAGLTGWAQVHGLRGQTSIAERAEWDNYYIENWSFALDLAIIVRTLKTLVQTSE